ncbi:MAG: radical SAM family heme chaperone HemW [bacterium]
MNPPPGPSEAARRLAVSGRTPRHFYIHLPYCERICPYCDFSTAVGAGADAEAFLEALTAEIELLGEAGLLEGCRGGAEEGTLFLGGGTPSWFGPEGLAILLERLGNCLAPPSGWSEATLEMNPEHADPRRMEVLRTGGITRLSLGAQSFHDRTLRRLGRVHRAGHITGAARLAASYGLHFSFDLIFAVPGQTLEGWLADLDRALAEGPHHISLYDLTYEEGTPFHRWRSSGRLRPLPEEWEAEAYALAVGCLREAGYGRYEVSNFARPGFASIHNRAYWSGEDYLGIGPSAHSLLAGMRTANRFGVEEWMEALREGEVPWSSVEVLDGETRTRERIMLGLRTAEGFALEEIPEDSRDGVRASGDRLAERGLARWVGGDRLVLTDEGMLVADAAVAAVAP